MEKIIRRLEYYNSQAKQHEFLQHWNRQAINVF